MTTKLSHAATVNKASLDYQTNLDSALVGMMQQINDLSGDVPALHTYVRLHAIALELSCDEGGEE